MGNLTSTLTFRAIDDVSKPARSIAQALAQTSKQAQAVAKAMSGSGATDRLTASLAKLKLEAQDIDQVSKAWKRYSASAKIAADSAEWTKAQTAGVRQWEAQTIRSLREVARERAAFASSQKRAFDKALAEPVGPASARHSSGRHGSIGGFISNHMMGALAAGYSIEKVYESGAHLAHERVRQSASGMSASEVIEAAGESARIAAKFPSIKLADANHMLRNARAIVGSYKEAADIVEPMAKLRVIAQGARPGQDVSEDFDQLVKGLEIKGVTQNPAKFREYMEGIAKGLNVFGDTLKPYQYYEMFKYGRQATPGLSSNFILGTAPTLAQELGGSSYGNAVSGFNRAIVGGRMEHSALKELYRLGLAQKGDLDFLKSGEVKGLKPGHAIHGWEVAQEDPNKWVKEYFLPALLKAGITSSSEIQKEVSTVFSNKVAAQMVSILATQQSRINKDLALIRGAPGTEAADKYLRNDPTIAMESLKNSIEGLTATLTVGTLSSLAPVMHDVAGAIAGYTARLTEFQTYRQGHPDQTSLGQKTLNRIVNSAFHGVDSDKAQSEFTQVELNDMAYDKLQRLAAKQPPSPKIDRGPTKVGGFDFTLQDAVLDDDAAGNLGGPRWRLQQVQAAHEARLAAQRKLYEFHRNVPRDMSMRGKGSDHISGSEAFGLPTLGPRGGLKGSSFGFGNYDPITGMPKGQTLPKVEDQTAKVKIDISEATAAIDAVIAKLNVLRAGVTVPITMAAPKGVSVPSLGPIQRGNFSAGGPKGE